MNIRESKEVPVEILEKGFSLTHLGVLEYAWRKDDVEKILQILERRRIPILGGDVYKIEGGNISSTFDSWYINNDGNKDFLKISLDKTRTYINDYERNNGSNFVYVLVY